MFCILNYVDEDSTQLVLSWVIQQPESCEVGGILIVQTVVTDFIKFEGVLKKTIYKTNKWLEGRPYTCMGLEGFTMVPHT